MQFEPPYNEYCCNECGESYPEDELTWRKLGEGVSESLCGVCLKKLEGGGESGEPADGGQG